MALYLLPALTLVAGAVLGHRGAAALAADPNAISLLGALGGLALGLIGARTFSRRLSSGDRCHPRLTRIVRSGREFDSDATSESCVTKE
jgi:positive regulator of sigma E activity